MALLCIIPIFVFNPQKIVMEIEFISHACFIVRTNGKIIVCDPWLIGKAFNNSWALLSKPGRVDWDEVDYIFISHEHPDHFSLPTLKSIDLETRRNITILYQKHASKRMLKAFLNLGFINIIELPLYKWKSMDGFKLYCGSAGSMDSFLAIRDGQHTVLNLNDCIFNEKQYKYIKREIGPINFLFTQFSFANWVGNQRDEYNEGLKKIEDIKSQIEIFMPSYTIPFASFIYFCNLENSRMNDWINTPLKISECNLPTIQFMYPNEAIDATNPQFDSGTAVKKYMDDFKHLIIDPKPDMLPFEDVAIAIKDNMQNFRKQIGFMLRLLVKPFGIYIHDLDKAVWLDFRKGKYEETTKERCKYQMCSQVCHFTFKYAWGAGTLNVSGMYIDLKITEMSSKYFFFQNMLSTDYASFRSVSQTIRTFRFFWQKKWELYYKYISK